MCVSVSILPISTILIFDFGTVPTMSVVFFVFHLITDSNGVHFALNFIPFKILTYCGQCDIYDTRSNVWPVYSSKSKFWCNLIKVYNIINYCLINISLIFWNMKYSTGFLETKLIHYVGQYQDFISELLFKFHVVLVQNP